MLHFCSHTHVTDVLFECGRTGESNMYPFSRPILLQGTKLAEKSLLNMLNCVGLSTFTCPKFY